MRVETYLVLLMFFKKNPKQPRKGYQQKNNHGKYIYQPIIQPI